MNVAANFAKQNLTTLLKFGLVLLIPFRHTQPGMKLLSLVSFAAFALSLSAAPLKPEVLCEEEVYSYEPADNGAGPMWCHGSTCLVRVGEKLFASGLETLKDAKPLNNCRWLLFTRSADGWQQLSTPDIGRTREPSPMAAFDDGRFFLSANPTLLTNRETYSGPARPEILQFSATHPELGFERLLPIWEGGPAFSEHSYRSFAADAEKHELILFQNIDYTHAEWSFLDNAGKWYAQGKLKWPIENVKPIRVCYPNVALKNRAVHFCGTSDIVEPNTEWRDFKKQLTGQQWDYTFRRLFYTWTPDVTKEQFHQWVELANLDATAGGITLGDLWLASDGTVHLLWTEHALDGRLREKFFPQAKQKQSLKYVVLRDGKILSQRLLLESVEGGAAEVPGRARFQVTPENRLFAVFYVSGRTADGRPISENRIMELSAESNESNSLVLPLKHPFSEFFTTTVRAGSPPSRELELLGPRIDSSKTISYARIRLY